MTPPVVAISCEKIIVKIRGFEPKDVTGDVSIQDGQIYVGSNSQWKIKAKELQHVDVLKENDNEIYIETSKESTFRFVPPHPQSPDEKKAWMTFLRRLLVMYQKHQSKEVQGFTEFLQKSSQHQLRGVTRHHHHQRTTEAPAPRPSRGVYGSSKAIPPIEPRRRNNDHWSDFHRASPTVTTSVRVAPNVISNGKTKRPKLNLPDREHFSSDEEDDNEAEEVKPQELDRPNELAGTEPELTDEFPNQGVNDVKENELGTQQDHRMDRDHAKRDRKVPPKRKLTKFKNLSTGRTNHAAEELSDDDEAIFGAAANVTTPSVQRLVSPHTSSTTTTTTNTLFPRSTTSLQSTKKSIVEAMDDFIDDDDDEVVIDKRQPSLHAFFQPKSAPPSMSVVKTPTRRTNHMERNPRTSRTTTIQQTSSSAVKATHFQDDSAWLLESPTRALRSPTESRRIELLGHDPSPSLAHRSRVDQRDVLQNDPIEECHSPPRRQRTHDQPHARSALMDRTAGAYAPLNFLPKIQKRIEPMLVNRFANSATTPAALVQQASDVVSTTHHSQIVGANTMNIYRKYRGLRNLGNTCYQNSSLQLLYSCRHLIAAMNKYVEKSNAGITKSICMVGQQLSRQHLPPVDSRMIKDAMDAVTDKYAGYEQRDAHEFISDLIDFVHDELQSSAAPVNEMDQKVESEKDDSIKKSVPVPTDDFCMSVQVCLKCCSCGYARNKEEMYRHLSIDVISDDEATPLDSKDDEVRTVSLATVQKSLEYFFQPEIREINCEKCSDGTHAEQTLRILSQPKLLLLHLKRFIVVEQRIYPAATAIDVENQPPNNQLSPSLISTTPPADVAPQIEYVFKKNKAPIDIPSSLSLETYHQDSSQPTNNYCLQSIVHHIGSRASSGHYTADAVRDVDNEPDSGKVWVSFDDGITTETTIERIVSNRFKQSTAYMLLYSAERI